MASARTNVPAMDEEGFLNDPNDWDSMMAIKLARMHGLDRLDIQQWAIIFALRKYYFSQSGLISRYGLHDIRYIKNHSVDKLFDNDGIEAWRIAGLPNPREEELSASP